MLVRYFSKFHSFKFDRNEKSRFLLKVKYQITRIINYNRLHNSSNIIHKNTNTYIERAILFYLRPYGM